MLQAPVDDKAANHGTQQGKTTRCVTRPPNLNSHLLPYSSAGHTHSTHKPCWCLSYLATHSQKTFANASLSCVCVCFSSTPPVVELSVNGGTTAGAKKGTTQEQPKPASGGSDVAIQQPRPIKAGEAGGA